MLTHFHKILADLGTGVHTVVREHSRVTASATRVSILPSVDVFFVFCLGVFVYFFTYFYL